MPCGRLAGIGGAGGDLADTIVCPSHTQIALILRHAFIPLDNARLANLCGSMDQQLRDIESALEVTITRRNESFSVEGGKAQAQRAVAMLQSVYDRPQQPYEHETFQR